MIRHHFTVKAYGRKRHGYGMSSGGSQQLSSQSDAEFDSLFSESMDEQHQLPQQQQHYYNEELLSHESSQQSVSSTDTVTTISCMESKGKKNRMDDSTGLICSSSNMNKQRHRRLGLSSMEQHSYLWSDLSQNDDIESKLPTYSRSLKDDTDCINVDKSKESNVHDHSYGEGSEIENAHSSHRKQSSSPRPSSATAMNILKVESTGNSLVLDDRSIQSSLAVVASKTAKMKRSMSEGTIPSEQYRDDNTVHSSLKVSVPSHIVKRVRLPASRQLLPPSIPTNVDALLSVAPASPLRKVKTMSNVPCAPEIGESGTTRRREDDLNYILDGMTSDQSLLVRTKSMCELIEACFETSYLRFLRTRGHLSNIFDKLHDAVTNPALALVTSVFVCILFSDPFSTNVLTPPMLGVICELLKAESDSMAGLPSSSAVTNDRSLEAGMVSSRRPYAPGKKKKRPSAALTTATAMVSLNELRSTLRVIITKGNSVVSCRGKHGRLMSNRFNVLLEAVANTSMSTSKSGAMMLPLLRALGMMFISEPSNCSSTAPKGLPDWFKEKIRASEVLVLLVRNTCAGAERLLSFNNRCLDKDTVTGTDDVLQCVHELEACLYLIEGVTLQNSSNQREVQMASKGLFVTALLRLLAAWCELGNSSTRSVLPDILLPPSPSSLTAAHDSLAITSNTGTEVMPWEEGLGCMLAVLRVLVNVTNRSPLGVNKVVLSSNGLTTAFSLISLLPSVFPPHLQFDVLVLGLGVVVNILGHPSLLPSPLPTLPVPDHAEIVTDDPVASDSPLSNVPLATYISQLFVHTQSQSKVDSREETESNVVAAYSALLLGCLLHDNSEDEVIIRSHMPNGELAELAVILTEFLEFQKLLNIEVSDAEVNTTNDIIMLIDNLEAKRVRTDMIDSVKEME